LAELLLPGDGFDIAITEKKLDLLDALGQQIYDKGKKVCQILGNVSAADEVEAIIARVVEIQGGLDVASIRLWRPS